MKRDFSEHLEVMEHELSGYDIKLNKKDYRVDGEKGIKLLVNKPKSKAVDYFYDNQNSCILVEFSDVARDREDLIGSDELIDSADSHILKTKLKKYIKASIRDEMVAKFKDSTSILNKLTQYYSNIPSSISDDGPKPFYIIYGPINDELTDGQQTKIVKFIRILKSQISDSLDDDICTRVKLIHINQIEHSF